MSRSHPFSGLALAGGLLLLIAGLGCLMFGVAGHRAGMTDPREVAGARVELLRDAGGRATFDEVLAAGEDAWRVAEGRKYLQGGRGEVLWLRITLTNLKPGTVHGMLADSEYLTDRADAWVRDASGGAGADGGGWRMLRAGEVVPGRDKVVWGRTAAFPITMAAGGEAVVYWRAADFYGAYVWPRWWPRSEDFFQAQVRDTLAEMVCFGGLAALLVYSSVLWLRLRFPDMGCYALYAAALGIFNFFSNGGPALLGLGIGSPAKEIITGMSLALSTVFLTQFARMFLGTAMLMPVVDRWLRRGRVGLAGLALSAAVLPWLDAALWFSAAIAAVTLTHLLLLGVAMTAWWRGAAHARFFVGAFGLLFAGGLPAAVAWLRQDMQAWAAMALLAGSLLEMLVLSFAVAERFAQTQRRLVEETEQRRAMQEAYADELEVEVRERTRELVEANADKDRMIEVIGHDLRSPLTAITGMAEMLTRDGTASAEAKSGFIAEAGHLGRQVLLLIEDLVLWARLRAGSTQRAEHSLAALLTPVVELHRVAAGRRGVRLDVVEVAAGIRVNTDLVLAQTLVRNLVSNALRYARTRVLIESTADDDGVRLTVTDDGPGLPATVAARLVAEEGEADWAGQGLGLRLCTEISRALGASLRAVAAPGGGTVFEFMLEKAEHADVSKK